MAVDDADAAARQLTFRLEMDAGFWLGVVVGNDVEARGALRDVARRWCTAKAVAFHEHTAEVATLREAAVSLVEEVEEGVHWLRLEEDGDPQAADRAFTLALAAMNERREEYRRTLRGPLVIEGRWSLRRRLREVAPDLFSIAVFIVDLGSAPPSRAAEVPADDATFEDLLRAWRLRLDVASKPPTVRVVRGVGVFPRVGVAVPSDRLRHNTALLAVHPEAPTREELEGLLLEMLLPEREVDAHAYATVVHLGEAPSPTVAKFAQENRVELRGAREFRRVIDFHNYLATQAEELRGNADYDPEKYVPQRMTWKEAGEALLSEDALSELVDRLQTEVGRFSLILGDFGTGKTFLMRQLAARLGEHAEVIPMLVNLRGLNKSNDLWSLLTSHLVSRGEMNIRVEALRYMMESGDIVLLFDGFDELAFRVSYDAAADYLRTLCQAVVGRCRVVVSSRTQHFRNDDQAETALARELKGVPRGTYALVKFDLARVRRFVWHELQREMPADALEAAVEVRMDLMRDIKDLAGLAETPRMLAMILKIEINDLEDVRAKHGTITAADLYDRLLNRWLEYEWGRSNPNGEASGLSRPVREAFVERFARRVWLSREGAVSAEALREEAAEVARGSGVDAAEAAHECGTSTLLRRDGVGRVSFFHQSVMEFLIARNAARAIRAGDVPDILSEGIVSDLTVRFLFDLVEARAIARCAQSMAALGATARINSARITTELGAEFNPVVDFTGQDLRGIDLSKFNGDLTKAKLEKCDLRGVSLRGFILRGANLCGAKLNMADLSDADLTEADLADADLTSTVFARSVLVRAKVCRSVCSGAMFLGADLTGVDFSNAILDGVAVVGAVVDPAVDQFVEAHRGAPSSPRRITAMLAGSMKGSRIAMASKRDVLVVLSSHAGRWFKLGSVGPSPPWPTPSHLTHRVRLSANGQVLAAISQSRQAWVAKSGGRFFPLDMIFVSHIVHDVVLDTDGTTAAVLGHRGLLIFFRIDGSDGQPHFISSPAADATAISFNALRGEFVSLSRSGILRFWSRSGEEVRRWGTVREHDIEDSFLSEDGSHFAILDERGCSFGEVERSADRRVLPNTVARDVAFSPDASECALVHADRISVWSVAELRERFVFLSRDNPPEQVLWARSSWLAIVDRQGVTFLSSKSGLPLGTFSVFDDSWVFSRDNGRYRGEGNLRGRFWHQINDCRFEAGELDDVLDLRLRDDEPLLPPDLFPPSNKPPAP